MEITLAITARRGRLVGAVLGTEALERRPGLDQRAIDREVVVRQEALDLGVPQNGLEELRGDVGIEQPVAVLGERRMIPYGIVDAEPDEPAEQQIVVDLLHQLALGAHRVERLQQRGAQQPLGCDRLPAGALVEFLELGIEREQHVIDERLDHA